MTVIAIESAHDVLKMLDEKETPTVMNLNKHGGMATGDGT